jgi:hypothetical protein
LRLIIRIANGKTPVMVKRNDPLKKLIIEEKIKISMGIRAADTVLCRKTLIKASEKLSFCAMYSIAIARNI